MQPAQQVEPRHKGHIDGAPEAHVIVAKQAPSETVAVNKILVLLACDELRLRKSFKSCAHLIRIVGEITAGKFRITQVLQAVSACLVDEFMQQKCSGHFVKVVVKQYFLR